MKTRKLWIAAAALVLAAACNRKDNQTGSVVSDTGRDRQAGNTVTLTGCLQPGEQGLASSPPAAGAPTAEGVDRFVLANARMAATSSAPQPAGTDAAAPLYIVEGDKSELQRHVSHQVEVTGRIDDNADTSSSTNQSNARRFKMDSVRDLAASCTP